MNCCTINGKSIADYKDSYTLIYMLENIMSTFNKLDEDEKKRLFKRFDSEISEKFSMPKANFIYENNENILDGENIYIGPINQFNSGLEFIARYFFEKRQQYQRICVLNNDSGSFDEEDFLIIKESFDILPISKEKRYIPYNKGFNEYFQNANKVDALLFMWEQLSFCLEMIDVKRIAQSINFIDTLKIAYSIIKIKKEDKKFFDALQSVEGSDKFLKNISLNYLKFEEKMNNEIFIIQTLIDSLNGKLEDKSFVIYCFNDSVWENFDYSQKVKAINICNEFIRETFGCSSFKKVKFDEGKNSYDFVNNDCIYVGNIKNVKPVEILRKLIYEYSFNVNYEYVLNLEDCNKRRALLKEIDECKKIVGVTGDYKNIRNYRFVKNVVRDAKNFQKEIYDCVSKYFVVEDQKIDIAIKKNEFVSDLYKVSKRR